MKKISEEILEAIWKADENGDRSLAAIRRGCPDEIEDEEIELLQSQGMVTKDGDNVLLTFEGRNEARSVVRRHRLAETLFATVLDLDVEKREEIACEVEHALLPEVEEAICTLLGHPAVCPDGKDIPPGKCCRSKRAATAPVIMNLLDLKPGERGRITYITPKHHQRLHRLTSFGLTPGTVIELHQRFPVFCIRYEGTEIAINNDVAEDIYVARIDA